MQSVPIITKCVNLNPAHGEVNLIQQYVIMFVGNLRQVDGVLYSLSHFIPGANLFNDSSSNNFFVIGCHMNLQELKKAWLLC